MPPQAAPRQTLEDIERLERDPLTTRLAVSSTYELLYKAVASSPEQPPRCLPLWDQSQPGEALTARAFLRKVHQSANLLADLGIGPSDVVALLLPDLLEKELLLWSSQATGIVCPIPPSLPSLQVVDLLQVARVKVLVAPSPEVDHQLWQKTELVRRQVKSIALVCLTHGYLLYTAWALSPMTTLAPEKALLDGLTHFFLGGWPMEAHRQLGLLP